MNELKIITHRPHQLNHLHDDVSNCKDSGYDDETAKDVHCNANFQSAHLEMDVQDRYKTSIVMMILVHHIGDDKDMAMLLMVAWCRREVVLRMFVVRGTHLGKEPRDAILR